MAISESKIKLITLPRDYQFPEGSVTRGYLNVEGLSYPHIKAADFPPTDPWSLVMRDSIARLRNSGALDGQPVRELGIGDGRNIRESGNKITRVEGVDVDYWRLAAAYRNLVVGEAALRVPVSLWHGDAVDYLQSNQGNSRERFTGKVWACLPQSPDGDNAADKITDNQNLDLYKEKWNQSGLTLNAAALDNLRKISGPDLRALVIISNRVPPEYRERMIKETGWEVEGRERTKSPIQQDPDTGIGWVKGIDDLKRFFEKDSSGLFTPISAEEAESRRKRSQEFGKGRADLNVYHHLTVYQLKPAA